MSHLTKPASNSNLGSLGPDLPYLTLNMMVMLVTICRSGNDVGYGESNDED